MSTTPPKRSFQAPKGTRDFYPEELLRRRYIAETWRAVSIRHGFEEIDGPTFEHAELYTVKSGEGILSELFSFRREGGDDLYALRPEFTPTLARMYAARARQLPTPTRWFCIPNFFRAENPQRGRLREFFQWNVDVLGGDAVGGDLEVMNCMISLLAGVGLVPKTARLHFNNRAFVESNFREMGVPPEKMARALSLLDRSDRMSDKQFEMELKYLEVTKKQYAKAFKPEMYFRPEGISGSVTCRMDEWVTPYLDLAPESDDEISWVHYDSTIVRGLAYYTGTVFEVIAEGERAIAGGGRYDNLIELFGGPPTPACGFGMGDVVLSLVLEDRGLMPSGMGELMDAVECVTRSYSMRPDAFVFSNGDERAEAKVVPLMAELRRGVETPAYQGKPWRPERYDIRPLHARTTGKSTRNVGKLLKDAASSNARFAVILESGEHATVKDLTTGDEHKEVAIDRIARMIAG